MNDRSSLSLLQLQEKLKQHIEKVVRLEEDEFAFVLSHFTFKTFKKQEYPIRKGEPVKEVYFVVSGLMMLALLDESGKQHVVSFAMEDWWESDFLAFFTQTNASMSLQCLEDTQVFCLSLDAYQRLCTESQQMERFFLQKANLGHIGSQQRILSFLTANARERYEQLLQRYPSLLQRVPKSLLAAYLGVSRETLSRLYR